MQIFICILNIPPILVDAKYEPPKNSLFEGNLFWKVLNAVRSRNEPRVVRDISPLLIPSAELLFMRGFSKLKDLTEEIQANWTKCVPRPDFTVGFQSSAFTDDEMEKLRYHSAPEKPTLFTGDLYFPFLICEVNVRSIIKNYILCLLTCVTFKCGENGLNIADRKMVAAPVPRSMDSFNFIQLCLEQSSFIERSSCFPSHMIMI